MIFFRQFFNGHNFSITWLPTVLEEGVISKYHLGLEKQFASFRQQSISFKRSPQMKLEANSQKCKLPLLEVIPFTFPSGKSGSV